MRSLLVAYFLVSSVSYGQLALNTAQIIKRVSPSVVIIEGRTDSGLILGSGFVVSRDGKIVTNLHVIRDLETASVHTADGNTFSGISVLATEQHQDLAIIQAAGINLPALVLADSNAEVVGERVLAIGNPRGLEGTVTAGILSSV